MSRIAKAAAVALGTGAVVLSGAGLASADAGAQGAATDSPGVLSGNLVQLPIHIPVNACGNTVDVIGLLNPAFGNQCAGDVDDDHDDHGDHEDGNNGGGYGS
ncbi:chaplin [Streptomyces kunmingensis]|uniref:Chaplin n=1 Tax=Streptomyces kunmingensis TaxID=68225 RepID=A0ABU6C727_9ACTN|nr:chaplin [Streptomyces kunmingensis]MEB3959645.1 chaplin [Streptomyces kunmingensis]